jgi:hypothetical protein
LEHRGPERSLPPAVGFDFDVANYGSLTGLLSAGKVDRSRYQRKHAGLDLPDVPTLDELCIKDADPRRAGDAGEVRQTRPAGRRRDVEAFRACIAREVPMYRDVIDKAELRIKSE